MFNSYIFQVAHGEGWGGGVVGKAIQQFIPVLNLQMVRDLNSQVYIYLSLYLYIVTFVWE